ncbi:MAG TPA: hypothetical protein VFL85_04570 [Candidatus Saccharimonadales bacterium]|nr:hypothetical protein [Candidatus Saccharimonadales bacterium]
MSVMLLLMLILLIAVLVIRAKINALHRRIEQSLGGALELVESGGKAFDKIKRAVSK